MAKSVPFIANGLQSDPFVQEKCNNALSLIILNLKTVATIGKESLIKDKPKKIH